MGPFFKPVDSAGTFPSISFYGVPQQKKVGPIHAWLNLLNKSEIRKPFQPRFTKSFFPKKESSSPLSSLLAWKVSGMRLLSWRRLITFLSRHINLATTTTAAPCAKGLSSYQALASIPTSPNIVLYFCSLTMILLRFMAMT